MEQQKAASQLEPQKERGEEIKREIFEEMCQFFPI